MKKPELVLDAMFSRKQLRDWARKNGVATGHDKKDTIRNIIDSGKFKLGEGND